MKELLDNKNILQPDYLRNPDEEFPKTFVADFIFSWIQELISVHGDTDLISDWSTKKSIKAKEFLDNAAKIAFQLKERGLVPGDIVCCLVHSDTDYFSVLLGTWMSGCVIAALQHSFSQELLLSVLRKSKAKVVFCDEEGVTRCLAAQKELNSHLEEIIVFGKGYSCTSLRNIIDKSPSKTATAEDKRTYDPEETIAIVFSSGTTGQPKGILLTHQNIYSFLLTARPIVNRPGMKTLFVPRIGNVLGLLFGLRSLLLYSHLHIISKYSDDNFLVAINEIKPTRLLVYLPHILTIIENPKAILTDLSSVEAVFTAGMLISKKLQALLYSRIPNLKTFFTFYGMTEVAVGTMFPLVDYEKNEHNIKTLRKRYASKPESIGRLAPMNQLKVVDETSGEILGPNCRGELCFKGPSAFKGYWADHEATNQVKRNGWVHTGDIGYYDEDGDIFFVSRSKDLIKYLGHHVIPSEIEAIIKTHPDVQDAAVIGLYHEKYGELPAAFVVLKQESYLNDQLDSKKLIEFVDSRVHDTSRLRGGLYFVEKIPRNVMGKITRHELRALVTPEFIQQ